MVRRWLNVVDGTATFHGNPRRYLKGVTQCGDLPDRSFRAHLAEPKSIGNSISLTNTIKTQFLRNGESHQQSPKNAHDAAKMLTPKSRTPHCRDFLRRSKASKRRTSVLFLHGS